jgi:ribosomal protein S12 methylthiotransferase accessory factor
LGAACRETWEEAVEKAYLEWSQGVFFTAYYWASHPDMQLDSYDQVNTFDEHAVYYTLHPEQWDKIALLKGGPFERVSTETKSRNNIEALTKLSRQLERQKVRLYYRDVTTTDLKAVGLSAVRAVSPDLAPIFSHQRYPYFGGRVHDVLWRYPWAKKPELVFPNPMPHPLG